MVNVIFTNSGAAVTQLKKIASTLNDSEVVDKLENPIVMYHPTCFSLYQVWMQRHTEEHTDTNKIKSYHPLLMQFMEEALT